MAEADGIESLGEFATVVRRTSVLNDVAVAEQWEVGRRVGRGEELAYLLGFVGERIAHAPPYGDIRPLLELQMVLTDRIRLNNSEEGR